MKRHWIQDYEGFSKKKVVQLSVTYSPPSCGKQDCLLYIEYTIKDQCGCGNLKIQ